MCYKRVRPARRTIIHPRHFSTSGVMAWRTVSMASSRRIQLAETSRLERRPVGWRLDSRQCRKQTRQRRDSLSLARSNGTIEAPRHFACPWAVSMRCLHGQILTEAEERERERNGQHQLMSVTAAAAATESGPSCCALPAHGRQCSPHSTHRVPDAVHSDSSN